MGAFSLFAKYPVARGMVTYAVLWPTADLCRQLSERKISKDKDTPIDLRRLLRFSLFGTLWVAPTVFAWVKISSRLIPGATFKVAALKAFVEQFSYGPFSICAFYFGMSLLEGKNAKESASEVQSKFWTTWKTGITYWPVVQTFNFSMVPERNRVAFVGLASFLWTTYLSFMKASSS